MKLMIEVFQRFFIKFAECTVYDLRQNAIQANIRLSTRLRIL